MTFDGTISPLIQEVLNSEYRWRAGVAVSHNPFLRRLLLSDQIRADVEAKANHAVTTFLSLSLSEDKFHVIPTA